MIDNHIYNNKANKNLSLNLNSGYMKTNAQLTL